MQPVNINALWGATLEAVEVDLKRQAVVLKISVVNDSVTTRWTVESTDVTRIEFVRGTPAPWTYAEITAASIEADGRRLDLVLWDEVNTLSIEAATHRQY
jgi:hypothetical protein